MTSQESLHISHSKLSDIVSHRVSPDVATPGNTLTASQLHLVQFLGCYILRQHAMAFCVVL